MNKFEEVEFLKEKFSSHQSCFLLDCRGLTVEEVTKLRRELRESKASMRVVKNTLASKASDGTSFETMKGHLSGPTSMVFPEGEVVDVAKTIVKLDGDLENMQIKVGVLDGQLLDSKQVAALSKLPGKQVMLGVLAGTLNAPVRGLAVSLSQVIGKLAYALKALEEQKANG